MADRLVFDEAWVKLYCQRTGKPLPDTLKTAEAGTPTTNAAEKKRAKYGNVKTVRHGRTFDSKHEADTYDDMLLSTKSGEIFGFACQVAFLLPGGAKYIADFVTMNRDMTFTVYDAKSAATRKDKTYRLKRRLMKECLGIEIQEI